MGRLVRPLRQPLRELLHLCLVTALALPALLGVLHRPPVVPATTLRGETALLWSDLAYLCTPAGAQREDDKRLPMAPMPACTLCALLHSLGWAVPGAPPRLPTPGPAIALAQPPAIFFAFSPQRPLRPPGRGPPAVSSTPSLQA